jgi:hypothetical protein
MADITQLQGTVGPATGSVGESRGVTLTKYTGLRTGDSQPRLQDAVERGNTYAVCNQAGVTSQAGLSATTPVLTLANPLGSGVNGILYYAGASFAVAFAAASAVFLAVGTNTAAAAVTGTLTTAHRNLKLGAGTGNKILTFLAATLPATPVAVSLLGMGLTGAITTVPALQQMERWFDGGIIIQPGTNVSIQTSTASGASGTFCEFIWEEVAV